MIYSIALLDQCDFDSIGRKMPNGSGVDASLNDGAVAPKHKPKKRQRERIRNEVGIQRLSTAGL
jgi:hypothetical protein